MCILWHHVIQTYREECLLRVGHMLCMDGLPYRVVHCIVRIKKDVAEIPRINEA